MTKFTITNGHTIESKVYYGLHMAPGIAEYREPGQEPFTILINEDVIKKMDPSFVGCPVFLGHVEDVTKDEIKNADGYVIESFFNKNDGKHWAKFIVVTQEGQTAIQNGFKLSNAYKPSILGGGGQWHGAKYDKEVKGAKYNHLAIVENPRYTESVIYTVEEFKAYNAAKEAELKQLANSKGEETNMFFKKAKLENELDIKNTMVQLPKSKVEMSIETMITEMDVVKNMHGYANGDHMVKVGDSEMSVNDLVKKHGEVVDCYNKLEAESKASAEKEEPEMKNDEEEADESMMNAKEGEEELSQEDAKKVIEKAEAKKKNFDSIKNASLKNSKLPQKEIDLGSSERGKQKYGSSK